MADEYRNSSAGEEVILTIQPSVASMKLMWKVGTLTIPTSECHPYFGKTLDSSDVAASPKRDSRNEASRPQIISDASTPLKTNGWTRKQIIRCSFQLWGSFGVSILVFQVLYVKSHQNPNHTWWWGNTNMTQQLTSSHFDRRSTPSLGLYCCHQPGVVLEDPKKAPR